VDKRLSPGQWRISYYRIVESLLSTHSNEVTPLLYQPPAILYIEAWPKPSWFFVTTAVKPSSESIAYAKKTQSTQFNVNITLLPKMSKQSESTIPCTYLLPHQRARHQNT